MTRLTERSTFARQAREADLDLHTIAATARADHNGADRGGSVWQGRDVLNARRLVGDFRSIASKGNGEDGSKAVEDGE